MSERWFAEGGTVLDENRLPVAHVVGQDEDNSDTRLMAAAPQMRDALDLISRSADVPEELRALANESLVASEDERP